MAQPAPLSTGETLAAVYDRLAALAPAHGRPPPDAEARDAAAKRPADGPAPEHPPKRPKTEENSSSGGSDDASRGGASSGDDTSGATADGLSLTSPLAPVVRMRTLAAASGETLQRLPAGRAGRMLVADDSYTVRRYLQRTFERKGYVVDVAQNGWQAFAQMQTRLYDFVFLDIEMPVMNGYRCAQAIRRWEARVEREQKQFICALTSHAQPDERELGLGIGPCGNQNLRRVRAESSRRPPRHRRDACSMAAALCSIYECRRSDTFTRSRRSLPVRRARTHHSHTHNGATPPRRSRVSTPCRHEDLVPHRSTEARTAASSPRNDLVKNCRCTRRTG